MIKKRGRPSKKQENLSKQIIIRKAKIMILSTEKIPSIRSIASELNVDPMALYYYFENKTALLESITLSLISDIYEPKSMSNWRIEIIKLSKSYLSILHRYKGLLQVLLSMKSQSPAHEFERKFNVIISSLNLDQNLSEVFRDLLVDYLHGFSIALECNTTKSLTLEFVDKPLNFIMDSVESKFDNQNSPM